MTTPTIREHELAARAESWHHRCQRMGALYEQPVGQTVVDALAAYREELLAQFEELAALYDVAGRAMTTRGGVAHDLRRVIARLSTLARNTAEPADEKAP